MTKTKLMLAFVGTAALGLVAFSITFQGDAQTTDSASTETIAFQLPALSPTAAEGERFFNAVCAACHGDHALGTDQGPPLVHDIYNPGHHADEAFFRAALHGVPGHHWPYGDMPPQNVTRAEIARIIAYVRELQEANGVTYRPHNM